MHFKRTFITILLLTVAVRFAAIAQTDEGVDLHALYQEIDDAISHSEQYISIRESQIKILSAVLIFQGVSTH